MPVYAFKCEDPACPVNLPGGAGTEDVSFAAYSEMRATEASGGPQCSVCKRTMKRCISPPSIATTRSTTPAKKKLDWAVGESADSQRASVLADRARFGGEKTSRERTERFKSDTAESKRQADEMIRNKTLVPRRGFGGGA